MARGTVASEDRLHRWLRRAASARIGDDGAVLERLGRVVVTVDAHHAGVHVRSDLDPRLVARRLLAVNLSDLAAMGARPRYAFLSLAAPPDYDHRRFLSALIDAARAHDLELAGGDLSRLPCLSATLTLIGTRYPRGRFVTRGAARPGSTLWIGGSLGQAAAGLRLIERGARLEGRRLVLPGDLPPRLARAAAQAVRRQLQPTPQLELGAWLGRRRYSAAIDVSDGLGIDLARLCASSGVGADVEVEKLPIPKSLVALSRHLGIDPLDLAVGGGEDYVLAFSLPPRVRPPVAFGCTAIGRFRATAGVVWTTSRGAVDLGAPGWDHLNQRPGAPSISAPQVGTI